MCRLNSLCFFAEIAQHKHLIVMSENEIITYDSMPEAMMHLLQEVAYIKNHLLNESSSTGEPTTVLKVESEYLTVAELSQLIKKSKGTIYNKTSKRQIPFIKKGNRVLFERQVILEWMREDRRKTEEQLQEEVETGFRIK